MPHKDPKKTREYNRRYYQANSGRILQRQKRYYEENKQKRLAQQKEYKKRNEGKLRQYQKRYKAENRERLLAENRQYYQLNREQVLIEQQIYRRERRIKALLIVANAWGDTEVGCRIDITPNTPVSDLPCRGPIQLDHLHGGGSKETRKRGSTAIHRDIIDGKRAPKDFRPLCKLHQLWNTLEPV